ncbi:MAG TPA: type II toxin-antitoxin system CcdA family antitoxin [Acetobacteraceae bacterium]|nr:type II toxin-antitoxin system CcdA family antitoxin [Acetobacteraceae bacterium]
MPSAPSALRKPTNVTLPEPLLREARELGISLSQACERGLREVVAETRAERWLHENRDAIEAWNEYVEKHGLPLGEYRQF